MTFEVCLHEFEETESYCIICGLECLKMPNIEYTYNSDSCYSSKIPQDDFDLYLKDVSDEIRKKIITIFESLLIKNNLRGDGKKALLSACYMYILLENNQILIFKDVCIKFNVKKKGFAKGEKILLTNYNQYRVIRITSSEYINTLLSVFINFNINDLIVDEIKKICKEVDKDKKFINYNQYSVCACVFFKIIEKSEEEKKEKVLKKNTFIKLVGMSDVSVQKILNDLNDKIYNTKNGLFDDDSKNA
uniref:Transcription factor TFIIB cyclin-like domain-containing protein n=1 Tax=viral metagenome TaxID=1070528 RepID=A0A6C0JPU0_9ZZZZ